VRTFVTVGALVALSSLACGDEKSSLSPSDRLAIAKTHFTEGQAAYRRGDFEQAEKEFTESYQFSPQPMLLYDIAQAARSAGHLQKALEMYRAYLTVRTEPILRSNAEQRIRELEREISSAPTQPQSEAAPIPAPPTSSGSGASEKAPSAAAAPAPPLVAAAAPPAPKRRLVRRGWFWGTLVAAAVVAGGAIALGVTLGSRNVYPTPTVGTTPAVP